MKKILFVCTVAGILCCLMACASKENDIKKVYEENYFEIEEVEVSDFGYENDEVTFAFKAVKEGETEATIISFSDSSTASEFYNLQYKRKDEESGLKKSRNIVIFGSKEAVELIGNK